MFIRSLNMNKQKLIELAEQLLKEENLDSKMDDLLFLKRQYKYLSVREEETYYEKLLSDRFASLYEELAKKEPKLSQSTYDEKKEIIALAKKLLDREDIIKASREFDSLNLSFKKAGRCTKEQDDELWGEFKAVKDEFNAKKRAYFEELDKLNAEKKAKKEEIITKAKELLVIKNLRDSNEKMDALMEEWKKVGYAGKDDEQLWREFSSTRREFNIKKREYHDELLKTFAERVAKKEELIATIKKLVADAEFSEDEIKELRSIQKEFNAVGFAGKDKDDDLNARFDEVVKQYFEEKKFYTL